MKHYELKIFHLIVFLLMMFSLLTCVSEQIKINTPLLKEEVLGIDAVTVNGILGEAIVASENGRVKTLPKWANG